MTKAEELIRSTTAAIASTVNEVPPLRLEPAADDARNGLFHPRAGRRAGRWRPWIAPVAAAVTVAAIAVALLLIKDIPNGRVPSPVTQQNSVPGVPQYYVAWMQADRPYLVVGDTATGKQVGWVTSPSGVALESVFGQAADDRTFVVTGTRVPDGSAGTQWYVLRIAPGSGNVARLTRLPIPVRQDPAGVAVSPDGTKLAVALPGTPAVLRIYSTATGALLRSWSAPGGEIMAVKEAPGAFSFASMVLRWSADGRHLAFAWNAVTIRVLDTAAPAGSLLATSSKLEKIVQTPTTAGTAVACDAVRGWSLLAGGNRIVCSGGQQTVSGSKACPDTSTLIWGFDVGTGVKQTRTAASAAECSSQGGVTDGAYLGWASADGSTVIGSLVLDEHARFGVFRDGRFTPLPSLPVSVPVPPGMLDGTDVW